MRMENGAICHLPAHMMSAMAQCDADDFCSHVHTLPAGLHQHHLREEGTLRLVADRAFVNKRVGIMAAMDAFDAPYAVDME